MPARTDRHGQSLTLPTENECIPTDRPELRGYLDHFWDQALAGFKAAVEQQTKGSE